MSGAAGNGQGTTAASGSGSAAAATAGGSSANRSGAGTTSALIALDERLAHTREVCENCKIVYANKSGFLGNVTLDFFYKQPFCKQLGNRAQ